MEGASLAPTLGPWLIGSLVSTTLSGLLLNQWTCYLRAFWRSDGLATHALVAGLLLICTVNWSITTFVLWQLFIDGAGGPRGQIVLLFMPVIAAGLAQSFYAYRCWRIWGRRNWVLAPIVLLVLATLGTGVTAIVFDFIVHDEPRTDPHILRTLNNEVRTLEAWTWMSAIVDVILCLGIVLRLVRERVHDGLSPKTESALDRLVRLSMQTAAMTALVAVANAIALETSSDTNAAIAFFLCVPYMYGLSTTYTLNCRTSIRLPSPHLDAEAAAGTSRSAGAMPTILREALERVSPGPTLDGDEGYSSGDFGSRESPSSRKGERLELHRLGGGSEAMTSFGSTAVDFGLKKENRTGL